MTDELSKNQQKKAQIVAEVAQKVDKSKILVFTNYQGMTHQQIEELKKSLKKTDAEYAITKNTLLKRALEISNFKFPISNFQLPTGALFGYGDPVTPLKELVKMIKKIKLPLIKFGIFEGKQLSEEEINTLSALPGREVLIARMLGGMKAPISNLVFVLNGNIQKLVMTLKAIEQKNPKF